MNLVMVDAIPQDKLASPLHDSQHRVMCVFTTVTDVSYSLTCFSCSTIWCGTTVVVRPS
jgi:hypothetical protein